MVTNITKVNILGEEWTIKEIPEEDDTRLIGNDGYCDWTIRTMVIKCIVADDKTLHDVSAFVKEVKRHEIVHAFLEESGLRECSFASDCWAMNEEMVDWFARNGEKIYKAWVQAEAV